MNPLTLLAIVMAYFVIGLRYSRYELKKEGFDFAQYWKSWAPYAVIFWPAFVTVRGPVKAVIRTVVWLVKADAHFGKGKPELTQPEPEPDSEPEVTIVGWCRFGKKVALPVVAMGFVDGFLVLMIEGTPNTEIPAGITPYTIVGIDRQQVYESEHHHDQPIAKGDHVQLSLHLELRDSRAVEQAIQGALQIQASLESS